MQLRPKASFSRTILFPSIVLLCLLFVSSSKARAQADPSEFKTESISVYAGYLHDNIDYYPQVDNGFSFGLDFTRHLRIPVDVSLEARANLVTGTLVDEKSYLGGLRVEYPFRRYHPYVDFMAGFGTIHFDAAAGRTLLGDNSAVYSPGLGIDIDLVRHFRAKIDFQHQYWKLGSTSAEQFQPSLLTLGVTYTIPFSPFHRQGQPHY